MRRAPATVQPIPRPAAPPVTNPPTSNPPPATPAQDIDGDGFAAPAYCYDADAAIHPGAADRPELGFIDSNCDGIDGDAAHAVFVTPIGSDANPGTQALPKRTLATALATAAGAKKDVYASRGTYPETLLIRNAVSVYGGSDIDWTRSLANQTLITGEPGVSVGAAAGGVTDSTTIQHVTIAAGPGLDSGASSYGIRASSSPGLVIEHVTVSAGRGAGGATGQSGARGVNGGSGVPGGGGECDGSFAGGGGGVTGPRVGREGGYGGNDDGDGGVDGQAGAGPGGGRDFAAVAPVAESTPHPSRRPGRPARLPQGVLRGQADHAHLRRLPQRRRLGRRKRPANFTLSGRCFRRHSWRHRLQGARLGGADLLD